MRLATVSLSSNVNYLALLPLHPLMPVRDIDCPNIKTNNKSA